MADESSHFYGVILAGGGGTRLWPKSRQKLPKHLLKLFTEDTLLQLTYKRLRLIFPPSRILVITHQNHLAEAQKQLPGLPKENWVAEPEAKNTALAIGVVAAVIAKRDPEAVILNVHSDQLIKEEDKFVQAAQEALKIAGSTDKIVTIAIKPTFAHTGLGYIRIGDQFGDTLAFKARGFKEKPALSTAQSFIASGQYLWNSGIYSWSVKNLFNEFTTHAPEIQKVVDQVYEALGTSAEHKVVDQVYQSAPSVAIDVAISEKSKNLVVVPGDFEWSDVGDWKVVHEMHQGDDNGNVVVNSSTDHINLDSENCFIESNDKLVVTIGLKDIVVVDTPDALLICHKDKTQDVKKVVEQLKAEKKHNLL